MNEKLPFVDLSATDGFGKIPEPPASAEPAAPPATTAGRCAAFKDDSSPCHAPPLNGASFCFFHDPEKAAERAAASRRGGEKGRPAVLPPDTPDFPSESPGDLGDLLGRMMNHVLRGELDPKIATTVGYLATIKARALNNAAIEARLETLEKVVKK